MNCEDLGGSKKYIFLAFQLTSVKKIKKSLDFFCFIFYPHLRIRNLFLPNENAYKKLQILLIFFCWLIDIILLENRKTTLTMEFSDLHLLSNQKFAQWIFLKEFFTNKYHWRKLKSQKNYFLTHPSSQFM